MNNNKPQLPEIKYTDALNNLHKSLLDALRQREQEIVRYIGILGPALAGFIWLLKGFRRDNDKTAFIIGTIGIILFLLVGAIYSLSLSYSYQCMRLQLKKLEESCRFQDAILNAWTKKDYEWNIACWKMLWKLPPEIIKVFWLAFVLAICVITISTCFLCLGHWKWVLFAFGIASIVLAVLLSPIYFGWKLRKVEREG